MNKKTLNEWYDDEYSQIQSVPQQQNMEIRVEPQKEEEPSEEVKKIEKIADIRKACLFITSLNVKLESLASSEEEENKDLKEEIKLLLKKASEIINKL
jgi:trehalose/maltose hydrolase-like predicted phosphorylase